MQLGIGCRWVFIYIAGHLATLAITKVSDRHDLSKREVQFETEHTVRQSNSG